MFDLIREIRDSQGAELFSELGKWKLGPEHDQMEFIWDLIEDDTPEEYGVERPPSEIRVSTKFVGDGQVNYRLLVRGKRVSFMRFDFNPQGESDEKLVSYMELMDQLLDMADNDVKKHKDAWGTKPRRQADPDPVDERPRKMSDIIASGDEQAILRAAESHFRWKSNEVIDLYNVAKQLNSKALMDLVSSASKRSDPSESVFRLLVNTNQ